MTNYTIEKDFDSPFQVYDLVEWNGKTWWAGEYLPLHPDYDGGAGPGLFSRTIADAGVPSPVAGTETMKIFALGVLNEQLVALGFRTADILALGSYQTATLQNPPELYIFVTSDGSSWDSHPTGILENEGDWDVGIAGASIRRRWMNGIREWKRDVDVDRNDCLRIVTGTHLLTWTGVAPPAVETLPSGFAYAHVSHAGRIWLAETPAPARMLDGLLVYDTTDPNYEIGARVPTYGGDRFAYWSPTALEKRIATPSSGGYWIESMRVCYDHIVVWTGQMISEGAAGLLTIGTSGIVLPAFPITETTIHPENADSLEWTYQWWQNVSFPGLWTASSRHAEGSAYLYFHGDMWGDAGPMAETSVPVYRVRLVDPPADDTGSSIYDPVTGISTPIPALNPQFPVLVPAEGGSALWADGSLYLWDCTDLTLIVDLSSATAGMDVVGLAYQGGAYYLATASAIYRVDVSAASITSVWTPTSGSIIAVAERDDSDAFAIGVSTAGGGALYEYDGSAATSLATFADTLVCIGPGSSATYLAAASPGDIYRVDAAGLTLLTNVGVSGVDLLRDQQGVVFVAVGQNLYTDRGGTWHLEKVFYAATSIADVAYHGQTWYLLTTNRHLYEWSDDDQAWIYWKHIDRASSTPAFLTNCTDIDIIRSGLPIAAGSRVVYFSHTPDDEQWTHVRISFHGMDLADARTVLVGIRVNSTEPIADPTTYTPVEPEMNTRLAKQGTNLEFMLVVPTGVTIAPPSVVGHVEKGES